MKKIIYIILCFPLFVFSQTDQPCSFTPPTITLGASCSYSTYTNTAGSYQSDPANGGVVPCATNSPKNDVWFQFTAPASGSVTLTANTGGITNGAMAVYPAGGCPTLGAALSCDNNSGPGNMPQVSLSSLTPGNTYWVRFWGQQNQSGSFQLCGVANPSLGPCGNLPNQDYCSNPALLTAGAGTFSSNTSSTYTGDIPANLGSVFCGSIENNSWYSFVQGSGTAATFNFTVSNCLNGYGIQAQVYDVTTDGSGCCTGFTSMSNCFNPGTQTNGTVTANGLVTGNTYYLMVDGNAGDVCDFSVANWSATGILSVQLTQFGGIGFPEYNLVNWTTESEINCSYYEVQRSYDGTNFSKIGEVFGAGTTNTEKKYSFQDNDKRVGKVYYRLNQVDTDGKNQLSDIIELTRDAQGQGIISLYPNPASDELIAEINAFENADENATIQLVSSDGRVLQSNEYANKGFYKVFLDISNLEKGAYFLRYADNKNQPIVKPFIKK